MHLFTETIRPSNRGCCKLLWAFFLIPQRMKNGQESPLAFRPLLSSLACLYSLALHGSAPCVSSFSL
jgi:hypothetical protein